MSFDVEACKLSFDGGPDDIPAPIEPIALRGVHDAAFCAALKVCGLSYMSVEINHGIRIALDTKDCEQRWLNGEDVFKEASREETLGGRMPDFERMLDRIIDVAFWRVGDESPEDSSAGHL